MPIITDRLKLSLPLGNEFVSREVLVQAFQEIDRLVMISGNLDELKEQSTSIQMMLLKH